MLANFAGYQGALAVDNMVGSSRKMEPGLVPNAVFTDPEIASVGLSEDAALRRNMNITVSRFDYLGSAMARILDETQGFVKLISEKDSGILLGGTIIGPKATEIVGILSLGVSSRLSVRDLRNAIFAHPTIAESIGEALR